MIKIITLVLFLALISTGANAAAIEKCMSATLVFTSQNESILDQDVNKFLDQHTTVLMTNLQPFNGVYSRMVKFLNVNDATYALLTYQSKDGVDVKCFPGTIK